MATQLPAEPPSTPDQPVFGKEWVVAFAGTIITALVAFGVDLNTTQQVAILAVVGFVAAAIIAWGAYVRGQRNKRMAAEALAADPNTTHVSIGK